MGAKQTPQKSALHHLRRSACPKCGPDPQGHQLRAHGLPITCGIYPQKRFRALSSHVLPGTPKITFGNHGGLYEMLYAATGFLLVRREVYRQVGGFDEAFAVEFNDVDFCLRLRAHGRMWADKVGVWLDKALAK